MINPTSSFSQMPPPPPRQGGQAQSLSDEQKSIISDTLSQFDPEELTEEDAQTIVETFSQAGIRPSQEMEKAMAELGFDAKSVGDLAGVGQRQGPPPPPQQSSEQITELVDYLSQAIEEKLAGSDSSSLTDEDKSQILALAQEKFGLQSSQSIINTTA